MSKELKNLLNLAIENSEGAAVDNVDPEDAKWLNEALSVNSVDLCKQVHEEVEQISKLLTEKPINVDDIKLILGDLIDLTEDIDLSSVFIKVGGVNVLLTLLFGGLSDLKIGSLQLLANVTQNNIDAQSIFIEKDVLPRLLLMIEDENNLTCLKTLFSAASSLARGYPPGLAAFWEANGFEIILNAIKRLELNDQSDQAIRKGSFMIYGLLQDVDVKKLSNANRLRILTKLVEIVSEFEKPEEFLFASMHLLIPTKADASKIKINNSISGAVISKFIDKLRQIDEKIVNLNDPADNELRLYVTSLIKVFE